jgi:molecular chaperone IbpA
MTKTLTLRSVDIPQLHKFGIGFDSILHELLRVNSHQNNYPPHNVIKTGEDTVLIEIAVAGFGEDEINMTIQNRTLTISGTKENVGEPINYEYLHRGLGGRNFKQEFSLAEYVEVIEAVNKNGILTIYLERKVPEENKPKTIDIKYTK